jgi:serine-type D-Ala-D-Ala carboxypeptidase (penicillin-binding protein 5/6)
MNIVATILMLVIAPLNTFLAVNFKSALPDKENKISLVQNPGSVEGAEKNNQESQAVVALPPVPIFEPIKKETALNLAIPNAHSSLIMDVDTKKVLFESDGNEQRQIASLTKMMTAVLAMEKVKNLDEEVTIDENAVYIAGTKIGCPGSGKCNHGPRLKVGEKISVLNLLKAMLMNSANDAAYSIGKHIAGSEDQFAEMMNEKAKELGLKNTHFCTASGLEPDGRESECYSSAYDIASIAAYAMRYDLIWQIMRLPDMTIYSSDGQCSHDIFNTDQVKDIISNCIGGKTGFTPLAGRSLLLAASDSTQKHKIIAVLLDDPYRWQDIKTMISWAFDSYEWK